MKNILVAIYPLGIALALGACSNPSKLDPVPSPNFVVTAIHRLTASPGESFRCEAANPIGELDAAFCVRKTAQGESYLGCVGNAMKPVECGAAFRIEDKAEAPVTAPAAPAPVPAPAPVSTKTN